MSSVAAKKVTGLLPVVLILVPAVLVELVPVDEARPDATHPATVLVNLCGILVLTCAVRALLNWPWKWVLRADRLLAAAESSAANAAEKASRRRELAQQRALGLCLCFAAPLVCAGVLLAVRSYYLGRVVLSNLNIAIFVAVGVSRCVLQLAEAAEGAPVPVEGPPVPVPVEQSHSDLHASYNQLLAKYDSLSSELAQHRSFSLAAVSKLQADVAHLKTQCYSVHGFSPASSRVAISSRSAYSGEPQLEPQLEPQKPSVVYIVSYIPLSILKLIYTLLCELLDQLSKSPNTS